MATDPTAPTPTAAAAPAAVKPARRPGRPRSGAVPPLEDVAAVANAAIAAGNMPLGALADHFGKPATTVRNWLYRARKAGLVDSEPSGVRVIEDHTVPEVPVEMPELQLVADTYREAVTVGRKPIQTIIDRFDATREQAHEWVNLARAAGLLPPRDEPQVPGVLPAGPGGRPADRMTTTSAVDGRLVHGMCLCCRQPVFSATLDGRRVILERPPSPAGRMFVRFDLDPVTAFDRGPAIDLADPHDDGTRYLLHTCPPDPPGRRR